MWSRLRRNLSDASLIDLLFWLSSALLVYMPLHTFLSRWLSLYTGGLMVWETGKDFVAIFAGVLAMYIVIREHAYRSRFIKLFIAFAIIYCFLHIIFLMQNGVDRHSVVMGTLYNGRIFLYAFIGLAVGQNLTHERLLIILKLLLGVSLLAVIFGFFQYFAPKDLMTHFGYSVERGAKPNFFIDDKPDFPRIMSTLREPNSFGAFLIVPLTIAWAKLINKDQQKKRRLIWISLFCAFGVALILTFSRSAWVGALIAMLVVAIHFKREKIVGIARRYAGFIVVSTILVCISIFSLRHSYIFQNVILHSDQSTVEADPNEKRLAVQELALDEIKERPSGHAPGTAGPLAFGNKNGGLITENYYLQIAYEVGVLGLMLFTTLFLMIVVGLAKRKDNFISVILFATSLGYIFIALLTHIWTSEAVAYQWFFLAGAILSARLSKVNVLQHR